jgi:4-alpha-glucanotransferase
MRLRELARALGVDTSYTDGLGRRVEVGDETLLRVCAALGAPVAHPGDAAEALKSLREAPPRLVPPVLVAWNGLLDPIPVEGDEPVAAHLALENGAEGFLTDLDGALHVRAHLPWGYHRLRVESGGRAETATVISAPERAWRPPGEGGRGWGVGAHLAALRSRRGGRVGTLADLADLGRWVGAHGGSVVTVLPLLPTFNQPPIEPSPYSPMSRLFWSELLLDAPPPASTVSSTGGEAPLLDLTSADAAVRVSLSGRPRPDPSRVSEELAAYARFRGAQSRLGRNWRTWPEEARRGRLAPADVDADEERFHLVAQLEARQALAGLEREMGDVGVALGLDLAVGVHPDGYDVWSRRHLFAEGVSVGAPPDPGFPSGQDWGVPPILPGASREEGHRYLAACIAHQASVAGILRIDHVMALTRLYWIPHGMGLHQGTYVDYPADELFAVLVLESHRNRCRIVGEDLGTVPPEIRHGMARHGIPGMHLAQFEAYAPSPTPPIASQAALVSSHDTPTLAGWIQGTDIHERALHGLLTEAAVPLVAEERRAAVERLSTVLGTDAEDPEAFLQAVLAWLGSSPAPLVIPWMEDLWMEVAQVNLPGTRSDRRPNWLRPMSRTLEEIAADQGVEARLRLLHAARARTD